MGKADYGQIAGIFDVARSLTEQNLEQWLVLIAQKIGPRRRDDFLDLGCGTGRFSIPISTRLGYDVTGADSSKDMLVKARSREGGEQVKWDLENAMKLSYPDESYDVVFMSHLLHHVDDPSVVIGECYRVLRPGGMILNRYGALEDICGDPEHRFFPDALRIDEARVPSIEQVEEWFKDVGFNDVTSTTIQQKTDESAKQRLERTRLQSTSVLTLIDSVAFERGLEAMSRYVSDNPDDPWFLVDKITLTNGRKG